MNRGARGGEVCKLALNALAHVIGTGAGAGVALAGADELCHQVTSLGAVMESMPARLRRASVRGSAVAVYAVVGFNTALGRLTAHVFRSPVYRPELSALFAMPPIERAAPVSALGVLDYATEQLAVLRESHSCASGGILTVAEMDPGGIRARALFDLDAGHFIDGMRGREDSADEEQLRIAAR